MAFLNDNFLKLKAGYLFPEIGRRVKAFCEANPEAAKRLIRCGIGDVTEPLPPAVVAAMHKAVDEMATRESFIHIHLNRIDDPQFEELYQRIDRLRGAITARTTEIEKLTAEREAYDRGTLVRGVSTIGGAIVLFIALIVILRAIL